MCTSIYIYVCVCIFHATILLFASSASSKPGLAGRLDKPGKGGTVFAFAEKSIGLRRLRVQGLGFRVRQYRGRTINLLEGLGEDLGFRA